MQACAPRDPDPNRARTSWMCSAMEHASRTFFSQVTVSRAHPSWPIKCFLHDVRPWEREPRLSYVRAGLQKSGPRGKVILWAADCVNEGLPRSEKRPKRTIHSQSIKTALHCFSCVKLPSVALHDVEFTFLFGFDSFRAHHLFKKLPNLTNLIGPEHLRCLNELREASKRMLKCMTSTPNKRTGNTDTCSPDARSVTGYKWVGMDNACDWWRIG
jgi:hypothetical protein